jgi:hypothetical protein
MGLLEMPTTNTDASTITKQKQQRALSSYYNQLTALNGNTVFREQPNTQMASVRLDRVQGCAAVCAATSVTTYPFRGGSFNSGPTGPS